jgi:chromosome segregation ATPase
MRDVTHISDSIKHSQPQIDELKAALKKAQQEVSAERKARQKAEESAAYLNNCSKEIRHSLATLQYRYETRMKQVHELKLEKQNILAEREGDDQRREKLQAENITLKDQQLQLQEELHTARDALKNSGNSSIAELELARETARTATDDAHRLQTSVDNIRKDFDFTRSAYQDASTKAAEYASQVSDLESANAELKHQASDERRRLAALNHSENRKRDLGRIAELEAELRNLSAVVGRVEEENKALRKGRGGVATRGSSAQPGAGAASPRPGSRGGSPAPGALLGANTHQFHVAPVGGRASALRNER